MKAEIKEINREIFEWYISLEDKSDYAKPYLLTPEDGYCNAGNRGFILGKETAGWLEQVADPEIGQIEDEYDNKRYLGKVSELVQEKEGGKRCAVCIYDRLERTALFAKENGFDIFTTTLSVSPHKTAELINSLGNEISRQIGVEFWPANFKKQNGFLRSTQLAKEHNIYRQNYCGCKFE